MREEFYLAEKDRETLRKRGLGSIIGKALDKDFKDYIEDEESELLNYEGVTAGNNYFALVCTLKRNSETDLNNLRFISAEVNAIKTAVRRLDNGETEIRFIY